MKCIVFFSLWSNNEAFAHITHFFSSPTSLGTQSVHSICFEIDAKSLEIARSVWRQLRKMKWMDGHLGDKWSSVVVRCHKRKNSRAEFFPSSCEHTAELWWYLIARFARLQNTCKDSSAMHMWQDRVSLYKDSTQCVIARPSGLLKSCWTIALQLSTFDAQRCIHCRSLPIHKPDAWISIRFNNETFALHLQTG